MKIIRPVEITDGATFSRASTATYFDKDGVLQTAGVNEPRWNHEYRDGKWVETGLLLEGEGTNLLTYSEQFDNAVWYNSAVTKSPNEAISPDGSLTADKVVESATSGEHFTEHGFNAVAGKKYLLSVFAKAAERSLIGLRFTYATAWGGVSPQVFFDLQTGTASVFTEGTEFWVEDCGSGWYRVCIGFTATTDLAVTARIHLAPSTAGNHYTGDGTSGLYIWGAQLEEGTHPTSYIPTTSAQVTRAADLITGTGLVTTNVPETDYPEWSPGTLNQGDRRILAAEHTVYEVVAATTTDDPLSGLAADPPTWMAVGATNRWKAFDDKVGTKTEHADEIRYSLMPGAGVDAVAFFGVDAGGVQVIVTDPLRGEIFNSRTVPVLTDGIETWWDYFFAPIELRRDFVVSGLGATKYCRIDIIIKKMGGTAKVGAIVMGKLANLGLAVYGTSVGITDYSRKERDAWGNTIIVERAFSKRADFQVAVETREVGRVQRVLAQYRATPIVWIGADNSEETLVYGFYRDFDIVIANPAISDANISVEGLT